MTQIFGGIGFWELPHKPLVPTLLRVMLDHLSSGDLALHQPPVQPGQQCGQPHRPEKKQEAQRQTEDTAGLGSTSPSAVGADFGRTAGTVGLPWALGQLTSQGLNLDGPPPSTPLPGPTPGHTPHQPASDGRPALPSLPCAPGAWHSSHFPTVPLPPQCRPDRFSSPASCILPSPMGLPASRPAPHPFPAVRSGPRGASCGHIQGLHVLSIPSRAPWRPRVKVPPTTLLP